ncbi:MAG: MBL fold metallo-hydrolase [Deltaproteobacteria bacterium]|nr:MBL fold metallo-hydrolase [Deltaproteobacteria bacterium]
MSTGSFRADYQDMVQGGTKRKVFIPIPFYLVHHSIHGLILIDIGLGEHYPRDLKNWYLNRWLETQLPSEFSPSDSAKSQLQKMGITSDQIQKVIFTHLHFDHMHGVTDFPTATLVVAREEWQAFESQSRFWGRLKGYMTDLKSAIQNRLQLIDFESNSKVDPFEKVYDLFQDGSVLLISTPGHTPGHQSVLLKLNSNERVLLTGDAVWVREGYEKPAPKSFLVRHLEEDNKKAWETTKLIHQFYLKNPEVKIITGHQPFNE